MIYRQCKGPIQTGRLYNDESYQHDGQGHWETTIFGERSSSFSSGIKFAVESALEWSL
jgi:hypothetical protein